MRRIVLSIAIAISAVAPASGAGAASGSVTATEGAGFSGQVGMLTTLRCDTVTAGPSGTISWGDGQASSASYAYVAGTFPNQYEVSGSHTYGEEGTYVGSVNSSYTCGHTFTSSSGFSAQVSDASLSATAGSVSGTAGHPFSGPVASFTDADPGGTAADYAAQISWGDGASSTGSITAGSGGGLVVQGSHSYATASNYQVTVTISDAGGASTVAHDSGSVAASQPPPVVASFKPRALGPGQATLDVSGSVHLPVSERFDASPHE